MERVKQIEPSFLNGLYASVYQKFAWHQRVLCQFRLHANPAKERFDRIPSFPSHFPQLPV